MYRFEFNLVSCGVGGFQCPIHAGDECIFVAAFASEMVAEFQCPIHAGDECIPAKWAAAKATEVKFQCPIHAGDECISYPLSSRASIQARFSALSMRAMNVSLRHASISLSVSGFSALSMRAMNVSKPTHSAVRQFARFQCPIHAGDECICRQANFLGLFCWFQCPIHAGDECIGSHSLQLKPPAPVSVPYPCGR